MFAASALALADLFFSIPGTVVTGSEVSGQRSHQVDNLSSKTRGDIHLAADSQYPFEDLLATAPTDIKRPTEPGDHLFLLRRKYCLVFYMAASNETKEEGK